MIRRSLYLSAAALLFALGGNAHAQDTNTCEGRELVQAGTFEAVAKAAGLIIGARWGDGTLTLDSGETHDFSFKGAKLMDFGGSETSFTGTIYNLEKVEDFPGTFLGVGAGLSAVTAGLGGVSMTNGNCVVLNAKRDDTEGLQVTAPIGPGGVKVELEN